MGAPGKRPPQPRTSGQAAASVGERGPDVGPCEVVALEQQQLVEVMRGKAVAQSELGGMARPKRWNALNHHDPPGDPRRGGSIAYDAMRGWFVNLLRLFRPLRRLQLLGILTH